MIRSKFALAATVLAVIGLPAGAANAANNTNSTGRAEAESASPRSGSNAGQRTICVREQLTGSHMTRRICKTAQEWEAAGGIPGRDRD